jgi:hypothetical protein
MTSPYYPDISVLYCHIFLDKDFCHKEFCTKYSVMIRCFYRTDAALFRVLPMWNATRYTQATPLFPQTGRLAHEEIAEQQSTSHHNRLLAGRYNHSSSRR